MKTNHTPGPWHARYSLNAWEIREANESLITHIPGGKTDDEAKAIAELIARAPALLAENARLREALTDIAQNRGNTCCNRLLCSERAARALAVERAKV